MFVYTQRARKPMPTDVLLLLVVPSVAFILFLVAFGWLKWQKYRRDLDQNRDIKNNNNKSPFTTPIKSEADVEMQMIPLQDVSIVKGLSSSKLPISPAPAYITIPAPFRISTETFNHQ